MTRLHGRSPSSSDTYDIYYANPKLLPALQADPAKYEAGGIRTLEEGREATVDDICDFIVEYINSDVMVYSYSGFVPSWNLYLRMICRACWRTSTSLSPINRRCDPSRLQIHCILTYQQDGVFDARCMKLAALCSRAVDYAKNGEPVNIYGNLPKPLIRFKPDWHKAEVTGARELDYYESDRALGHLFRNISLHDPKEPIKDFPTASPGSIAPLQDTISCCLAPFVQQTLNAGPELPGVEDSQAEELYAHFEYEMRYICVTHTLVDAHDVRLTEEEVVLGTILANCTQQRWRTDRSYRMKLHAEGLVHDMRARLVQQSEGTPTPTPDQLRAGLSDAWAMWGWAQHHRDKEFFESFSLVMLGIILDCLKNLGGLPEA
jgi:RNA-dependent RNA polymerase